MSFLYDGGGTELQESNITMGLANDSDSLLGIDSTIPAISNWNTTDDSSFGNAQALKSTVGDNDGYRFLDSFDNRPDTETINDLLI